MMPTDFFLNLITKLEEKNWVFENDSEVRREQPQCFSRYAYVPDEYMEFISKFKILHDLPDKSWFLSYDDFNGNGSPSFKWNEFEIMSLLATDGDTEWEAEIKAFWDEHIPIYMSVESGYSFLALKVKINEPVKLVFGREPEFEETAEVTSSFFEEMF